MAFRSALLRPRCLLSLLVACSSLLAVHCQTAVAATERTPDRFPPPTADVNPTPTTAPFDYDGDDFVLPSNSSNNNKYADPPATSSPCTEQQHHHGLRHEPDDHGCSLHHSPKPSVIAVITVISFFWVVGTCCISICLSMRLVLPADDDGLAYYISDEEREEDGTVASTVDYCDEDDDDDQEQATSTRGDQELQKPNEQESTAPTVEFDATSDSEVSSS